MTRHCKCEIGANNIMPDGEAPFEGYLFCPWCGVRLIADCHTCGIPANTHTGNTLYWYEDKDFCSASCARKLDMNLSKETESRET